jgi:trans-o-hydroxybenzylidenepyruvate hydratase-aldolase
MPTQRERLTANDVHGAWCIIPTPAVPQAEDWRCEDSVDYDEVARVVDALCKAGVDAIMAQGTFGEGATLTWEEKSKMQAVMVEAARGRIPIFVGTTTLNTRDTIRQLKHARDIGADGTMLGLPMWQVCDVPGAVRFYKDVAEAVPELAICIYANPEAFKFQFPTPFWAGVAEIPQVITCKYIHIGQLSVHAAASKKRIRFLPIEFDHLDAARLDPEFHTAFWSPCANGGPEMTLRIRDTVRDAIKTGDWSTAQRVWASAAPVMGHLMPPGGFPEFSRYNIQLDKARINASGWMKAGPCRPPYQSAPQHYLDGAVKAGKGWAELCAKVRSGEL